MDDIEVLQYLTAEQKDKYMSLQRLFQSPGWDIVVAWARANAEEAQRRQLAAASWDQANVARGATLAFRMIQDLETGTDNEFAALAAQAKERITLGDEEEHE